MLSTAVTSEDKLASASAPPTQRQPTTKTEAKGGSYMQAMTADMMWEWPAEVSGDGTPYTPSAPPRPQAVQKVQGQLESQLPPKVQGQLESQLPPKVQGQLESQLPPKHVGSPMVSGRKVTAGNPAPTTLIPGGIVHYGFVPHGKRDIPEATQPCELPGSRNAPGPDVITVPPQKLAPERSNSSSVSVAAKSTKAVSIEQAGRQMESYAPLLPGGVQKPMDYGEEGVFDDTPPNVFCMELSALVTGTAPVEKPAEYLAIPGVEDKRPSIMSNISVGTCVSNMSVGTCVSNMSVGTCVSNISVGTCVSNMSVGTCVSNMSVGTCVSNMSVGTCVSNMSVGICVSNIQHECR